MRPTELEDALDQPTVACFAEPPMELVEFVRRLTEHAPAYEGPERRLDPRFTLTMTVPVQPLDHEFEVVGSPFTVITRTISLSGISFFCIKPISAQLLSMQLRNPQGDTLAAIVHVLRCTLRGPMYEIGAKFIDRI